MARIPEGASLIANPVSKAPGFQLQNVFVLAGVPSIMRAMLDDVYPLSKAEVATIYETSLGLRRLVDVPALLVMRLFDCHERCGTLSVDDFRRAISVVESYVFRRAICGEQTRSYWQVFANLTYQISDESPLADLEVGIARLRDAYRFPTDTDFRRELLGRDIYALRVCSYLLDRLENHGSREPTDTSNYTIEHILPQNERLPEPWQRMLGPEWKTVQKTWVHRLGNLTLTGYNSTYSDRPFDEKKTISGGFEQSSVRLNKFVREQPKWTTDEIEKRGHVLADRALQIWPVLQVDPALVEKAKQAELRELAQRRDVAKVPMSTPARALFEQLRAQIKQIDPAILELAEVKSVSYHGPGFSWKYFAGSSDLACSSPWIMPRSTTRTASPRMQPNGSLS
jgi:hypothetical protein